MVQIRANRIPALKLNGTRANTAAETLSPLEGATVRLNFGNAPAGAPAARSYGLSLSLAVLDEALAGMEDWTLPAVGNLEVA
jgi:hypothetical protein